jgi:hypothetical protein
MIPAVFGPLATTWFGFLQRRVRIPGSPNAEILARVGLDQTVLAPLNLFAFLSSMAIMEGSDPQKKIESTYWNALSKNWMLWPFVQAVNFKFVPLQHRVLVVNFVSLGMYRSLTNNNYFVLTKFKAGTATSPTSTLPAPPFPRNFLHHRGLKMSLHVRHLPHDLPASNLEGFDSDSLRVFKKMVYSHDPFPIVAIRP